MPRKPNFTNFAEWLFPGDPVLRPNASKLPVDVTEVLDEVACGTGVEEEWLERSARMVLDGISGLRCLWYLHGAEGSVEEEATVWLAPAVMSELDSIKRERVRSRPKKGGRPGFKSVVLTVDIDWNAGIATELTAYFNQSTGADYDVSRQVKLGKWLRKQGASSELLHAFETRAMPKWDWKISTHPFDVLTMSYRRPWTSCMRPGGAAELGPLTDMAAGSAIMFFYRPGAEKPAGRLILRPAITGGKRYPRILHGGTVYGSGPEIDSKGVQSVLSAVTGVNMPVRQEGLCAYGEDDSALTRFIYSDTDRDYCQQTDEEYAKAYERMGSVEWPPSALELGDLHNRAGQAAQLVESTQTIDMDQLADDIATTWVSITFEPKLVAIRQVVSSVREENIPNEADFEHLPRELTSTEAYDLKWKIIDMLETMYTDALREEPVTVLALSSDPRDSDYVDSEEYDEEWSELQDVSYELVDPDSQQPLAGALAKELPAKVDPDDVYLYVLMPNACYLGELAASDAVLAEFKLPAGKYQWNLEL